MAFTFENMIDARMPVIFDGAMGTELQKYTISADDVRGKEGCNEILNITRPDIVREVHGRYITAGANVVETNTFGGNRQKLSEYGIEDSIYDINRLAAVIAREAVEQYANEDPVFICGTMGPTGVISSSAGVNGPRVFFKDISEIYSEQAAGLLDGGVDLLLLETMQDLLEIRAALHGIRDQFNRLGLKVPVQIQVSMDASGHMLMGSDVSAFMGAVGNFSPAVVGMNCGVGPKEMKINMEGLKEITHLPLSMIPNAGIPENIDGKAYYRMDPETFAQELSFMVCEVGVSVVGGCCGTSREHIEKLVGLLSGKKVAKREKNKKSLFAGTLISGVDLQRSRRPIIIGERLNVQGSRKTKELLLSENWEELYRLGLEQQRGSCALIDLCTAVNEQDNEQETMKALVGYLAERLTVGFCIDSTEPSVIEQALSVSPGSVLINSINLERGGEKARRICGIARDFGCPVIALPIDDKGMAKTVVRKIEMAHRIRDLVCGEFGIPEHHIFFDPLVFTLATGDIGSAGCVKDSLEALRKIKAEFLGMQTVMGISNVSFGLKPNARRILNNLLLHHAAAAGLDAAIFNPKHLDDTADYTPEIKEKGDDLLFNRKSNALELFIGYFENADELKKTSVSKGGAEKELNLADRLKEKIVERDRRNLKEIIDKLLKENKPEEILNTILLPAMAEVGEKMEKGEYILPFVLQAAEVMKEALGLLRPHLKRGYAGNKGKILLATVFGDIHDIGKNLVGSILKNQGFDVVDLGKQVPVEDIVASVKRERPDAVGLSALLVTTSREMGRCVAELDRQGMSVPVLVGGAAVNRRFAERIRKLESGTDYSGGVYYAKDAFEAAEILGKIKKGANAVLDREMPEKGVFSDNGGKTENDKEIAPPKIKHESLLVPPFFGTGDILTWQTESLFENLDRAKLYRGYWRGGKLSPEDYERSVLTEFEPVFIALKEEILENRLIDARGYYGFFSVIIENETVVVIDPSDFHTELASYNFPRVNRKNNRSIADFLRPEGDLLAVQIVTIGGRLGIRSREYFQHEDRYSLGYYLNSLGSYLAEYLAERVTAEIRRGLFLPPEQGKRYSFGYPGMPGLEDQLSLFNIICAEERLGIKMTEGFQMDPEHTTLGIYIHSKDAEYLA